MTAELRQQCLTDGEIPVHLGHPPTALLLGAVGLDHGLGGLGDLLLGGVSVHLAAGVVSLLLIVLGSDKDLTLPLKFFFCCFPTATWTTPFTARRLKMRNMKSKIVLLSIKKLEKHETDT